MNQDITPLLTHLKQYILLNESDIENITNHSAIKTYEKGEFLVEQGKICLHENYIIEGCTYSYILNPDGKKHVLRFAFKDWWATDLGSLLNQEPATLNIHCLKKTTVVQFSRDHLNKLYSSVPVLERFFRMVTQKAFIASQKRIYQKLSLTAGERYQLLVQQYPFIEQDIPQYLIASYLGITKQFLSQIRSEI